ncbi:10943_t:CDS:1, partial [Dentiscutata heterogama]
DFATLSFKIRVETTNKETSTKLSFLDKNDELIKKPEGVFAKDITKKKGKIKELFCGLDFYLLNHSNKYVFYYDEMNTQKTKDNKIYFINCSLKKSHQIFNIHPV